MVDFWCVEEINACLLACLLALVRFVVCMAPGSVFELLWVLEWSRGLLVWLRVGLIVGSDGCWVTLD